MCIQAHYHQSSAAESLYRAAARRGDAEANYRLFLMMKYVASIEACFSIRPLVDKVSHVILFCRVVLRFCYPAI